MHNWKKISIQNMNKLLYIKDISVEKLAEDFESQSTNQIFSAQQIDKKILSLIGYQEIAN